MSADCAIVFKEEENQGATPGCRDLAAPADERCGSLFRHRYRVAKLFISVWGNRREEM
jgi:hypothetical protein